MWSALGLSARASRIPARGPPRRQLDDQRPEVLVMAILAERKGRYGASRSEKELRRTVGDRLDTELSSRRRSWRSGEATARGRSRFRSDRGVESSRPEGPGPAQERPLAGPRTWMPRVAGSLERAGREEPPARRLEGAPAALAALAATCRASNAAGVRRLLREPTAMRQRAEMSRQCAAARRGAELAAGCEQ